MDSIEKLLYLSGVSADYLDYSGTHHTVPRSDRVRVLRACGYSVDSSEAVEQAVYELDAKPWESWLRPQYIVVEGALAISFSCPPDRLDMPFRWQVHCESGEQLSAEFSPSACPETGDYHTNSLRYSARQLPLPQHIPLGYHRLTLECGAQSQDCELIVCPPRCHEPLAADTRLWGVTCQLYTLRSARNWGVGDFTDLMELVELSAAQGAHFIGLNPLHASCSDYPEPVSPYSPSDRRFLSPLYIDPEAVPDFNSSKLVRERFTAAACQAELAQLRQQELVDYAAVNTLKYQFFELMYQEFCQRHLAGKTERARDFADFVQRKGEPLQDFSRYETTSNSYASAAVNEPRFYSYLQWLAHSQLQQCQQDSLAAGMQIGLLGDLAVGSVGRGCEVVANPDLYLADVTIGAPPDPLAESGQDWGLPVVNPVTLKGSGFRHFISLLRANMESCGALRIDHAMALMRLWWCLPADEHGPATGLYIFYPLQDLLALLRLESVRNRCLIVGEDLGVVPAEFRTAMAASGIYSNNLLYFEQHNNQYFKPPREHQADALLMVTNHDVSTLADWWNKTDLQRRFELGLLGDENDLQAQLQWRDQEKQKMLNWLAESDSLPENRGATELEPVFDYPLCEAIHHVCAMVNSQLLLLQLEDLQLLQSPVNIPGTYREYPNWQRKQTSNTRDIFSLTQAQQILQLVSKGRKYDNH
ncbi:4-alpha-glucanotransferase [Pseudomaricurvus alcaniphilus]|uniref:4-alpha-glucanotransferase n=1 Tax=Pseudomaricurvus alcaniphilus TaxID=1166482 RepID=UPI00140DBF3B|nr:4-alpha-glucanotransferase [Pseudomaricurvus alcaniphilus]NHN37377.1 4-alpha-glucanotransferase [Pseudomaricurvus alcaniphilus]